MILLKFSIVIKSIKGRVSLFYPPDMEIPEGFITCEKHKVNISFYELISCKERKTEYRKENQVNKHDIKMQNGKLH